MLDILFLGTGAAVPSRDRTTSAVAVRSGRDIVLMDCGEGTQRQLMVSPFSFMKIGAILITHMHGDHVLGLPGLLQTMGLSGRKDPLTVYGPGGLESYVRPIMEATEGETGYGLEFVAVEDGGEYGIGGLTATAFSTDHSIESFGYVIREADAPGRLDRAKALSLGLEDGPDLARIKNGETVKGIEPSQVIGEPRRGLSMAYTGDTRPCPRIPEAAKGVDVLVHEATYMSSESKLAEEHAHSTVGQAARDAADAGARHLILTHISNRYKDRAGLEAEARALFPESYVAEDMRMYSVTRGSISFTDSD
jgi:ribonuclease Z